MSITKNSFQKEMEDHLINKFKIEKQYLPPTNKKKWLYHDMGDNLFPPIKHGFLQYVYNNGIPLHDFVNHVCSSQIFAVNLFFPLLQSDVDDDAILKVLNKYTRNKLLKIIDYEFEYSADDNILGEWKSNDNRPEEYVTAADLAIFAEDSGGNKFAYIIEVKFTESGFSECGGYSSRANKDDTKKICNNSSEFLKDFKSCFLHGGNGKSNLKRTYYKYFNPDEFDKNKFSGLCPFISNHQCFRNHALARALKTKQNLKETYFVLVYHDKNTTIVQDWQKYIDLFSSPIDSEIFKIPANEFIRNSKVPAHKEYFKDRYVI